MNLKDLKDMDESDSNSTSSSSSSGGGYPKTEARIPYFAIWEGDDGELVSGFRPQNQFIEYRKKSSSASWERHLIPEEMERYWMDKIELKRIAHMVEEHFDVDAMEQLKENPENGLALVRRAAKRHSPQKPDWDHERCPVCREKLHVRYDDYEIVDNRRVCSNHNVHDLKKAGLLD